MPLVLIGSGLILVLVGLNNGSAKLYQLLANDFTGPKNFVYWFLAILILGALGYIPTLEKLSRLFLILVLVVLFLDNGGFFSQFQAFVKSSTAQGSTSGTANSTGAKTTG